MPETPRVARVVVAGLAAGAAAGLVMDVFSATARALQGGREAPGAALGRDRFGRGAQPPQAVDRADDDAAVKVGTAAYELVSGERPPRSMRTWLGTAAHYGFSGSLGATYAALNAGRKSTLARGLGFGAVVWLAADEIALPMLGLSRGPRRLDPRVHAYSFLAHLVFGASLHAAQAVTADVSSRKSEV